MNQSGNNIFKRRHVGSLRKANPYKQNSIRKGDEDKRPSSKAKDRKVNKGNVYDYSEFE